jgi:UDP-N-acetylmuramyl pentapeptide synthase
MLELGIHSESFHREAGEQIPSNISLLITVGQRSLEIARGAEGKVESVFSCQNSKSAAQTLRRHAQAGDAVLIKGSRGMKLEQILEELKVEA